MTEESPIKRPMSVLAAFIIVILGVGIWAARAPNSVTGKLPFIGNFPIELNAVYFVIFGPMVGMVCAAGIWMVTANRSPGQTTPMLLPDRRNERTLVAAAFGLIVVLSVVLSMQYFLILAPKDLCPTRPHFEFLWTNFHGLRQIWHCMSETDAINAHSPYYFEPQMAQAWGHVLWPLLTCYFLIRAWLAWTKGQPST
jgi:hypothetical protein